MIVDVVGSPFWKSVADACAYARLHKTTVYVERYPSSGRVGFVGNPETARRRGATILCAAVGEET